MARIISGASGRKVRGFRTSELIFVAAGCLSAIAAHVFLCSSMTAILLCSALQTGLRRRLLPCASVGKRLSTGSALDAESKRRYLRGEPKGGTRGVVRVPSVAKEDRARLHRSGTVWLGARFTHVNRINVLLRAPRHLRLPSVAPQAMRGSGAIFAHARKACATLVPLRKRG